MNSKTIVFLLIIVLLGSFVESKMKVKKSHSKLSKSKAVSKTFLKQVVNTTSNQAFCFLNSNGTVYDLNPLHNSTKDYSIRGLDYLVNFNVCKNALTQCKNRTASVIWNGDLTKSDNCIVLAGPNNVVSKWSLLSNN
jgi:hypothetical protein